MPLLGNLLVSLVTVLINMFAKFMAFEKAFRLSAVLLMLSFIGVMVGVMSSCTRGVCAQGIAGMSGSHPNLAVGLGLAFNSITLAAGSAYVAVWLGCQLYVMQKKGIDIITK